MDKGNFSFDPTGLIFEAYRIENIQSPECRTIFLDWALGVPVGEDTMAYIAQFLNGYGKKHPEHPMTQILKEGQAKLSKKPKRRGGRSRLSF